MPPIAEESVVVSSKIARAPDTSVASGATRSIPSQGTRFVRAYLVTFQVILGFMTMRLAAWLRGRTPSHEQLRDFNRRSARRVYQTILELQGLYIKVGQLLSILANVLPEEFRSELSGLQDQVPPRPYDEIVERIERELGGPVGHHFVDFQAEPMASASLGQVHEARLRDGTRVVVKVQHRDVDEIVRQDLRTIRQILRIIQWFFPIRGLDSYYHQVKDLLEQELDFEREAASIEHISKNFVADPMVVFPRPIAELSTKRLLTATFVEGRKVSDAAAIDAMGVDRADLARRLTRIYCQMIFVDGTYHADPHPGNVLVRKDGAIVLLDFGAVAVLSREMREGIAEFLEAVLRRDTAALIKAMGRMGFLARTSNPEVSERVIEYFHRRFHEEVKLESFNLRDLKVDPQRGLENLLDLKRMGIGIKELSEAFVVPKEWVHLERTLLLLYGTCSQLDPGLNPMTVIQPYLQEFVLGSRDWTRIAMATVGDMFAGVVTLPEDIRRYLAKATRGELEMKVQGIEESARTLYVAARQLIYTAIAIAAAYGSESYRVRGSEVMADRLAMLAGGAAFMLVMSSLFSRPRIRTR